MICQRQKDWMVEQGEFEQPVPSCKQSNDGISLRFGELLIFRTQISDSPRTGTRIG
jgi:hypothetical protein